MLANEAAEPDWVSVLSKEQTATASLHQSPSGPADVKGLGQSCHEQGREQGHRDRGQHESRATEETIVHMQ